MPEPAMGKCGAYTVSQVYPQTGALRIDKAMPQSVQLNAPFEYTIKAINLTDQTLSKVMVKDHLSDGLKYVSSTPAGKLEDNALTWEMNTFGPKAVETIVVKVTATEVGCMQTCAYASYIMLACAKTEVVQPALAISKMAPESVTICDPIPFKFVVTNKGSGTATNVKLSDKLPAGLMTQDGKTSIDLSLGNLAPGQSKTQTVMAKAAKPGTYKNQAMAMADGNLKAESEVTTTKVTQPVLAIEKSGPKKIYLERSVQYDITVTNKGDSVAANTVVTDSIPAGVTGIKASSGGALAGNMVSWNLGDLAPKASKKVSVSYTPSSGGEFKNTAKATAVCAEAVSASAATVVEGIPAVLLEVIDIDDPIEVGNNETYIITVTNQGSASDTDIVIKAMLEDTMEYVSSSGATNGQLSGSTVTFSPLPSLAPKAKATWKVVIKAKKAGDVRFSVTMNSDQLGRDVSETEATNFYE
jgi:uncharacterized repeat protein (TIGR01451 family)